MAKKRSREHLAVTLFPFLSILACVIGVLTLMITALALGQIGDPGEDAAAVARAEEYLKLQAEAKRSDKEMTATSQMFKEWKAAVDALDKARSEAAPLATEKQALASATADADAVKAESQRLAQEIAAMRSEVEKTTADNTALAVEIEKQGKLREATVKIQPGGSGVNLKPTFIECAAAGLVIYDGGAAIAVPAATIPASEPFHKLLDRVAAEEGTTIVFLVRPKGIGTYNTARALARQKSAHNGKLPVPGEGRLDLSLFANPSPKPSSPIPNP